AAADRLDGPDRFVAANPPVRHGREVSLKNMKVCTTNRRGVHPHYRVRIGIDFRLRGFLPGHFAWSVVNKGTHHCLRFYRDLTDTMLAAPIRVAEANVPHRQANVR